MRDANARDSGRGTTIIPETIMKSVLCSLIALFITLPELAGSAAAQNAAPINIALTDYAFTPSTLNLETGTMYRFHLTNSGSKAHSFNAPEFFAASQISPADEGKVESGRVELDSGEAVDLTVTPSRAGTYSLDCSHFMHSMLGMHGKIVVQ
ncbi:MAG TPA: cupredoxin domain-containing protein [Rhizomicrobium sp.]|nr:cupredoxin domain-containing protein [Rhizomicrobium sp.]